MWQQTVEILTLKDSHASLYDHIYIYLFSFFIFFTNVKVVTPVCPPSNPPPPHFPPANPPVCPAQSGRSDGGQQSTAWKSIGYIFNHSFGKSVASSGGTFHRRSSVGCYRGDIFVPLRAPGTTFHPTFSSVLAVRLTVPEWHWFPLTRAWIPTVALPVWHLRIRKTGFRSVGRRRCCCCLWIGNTTHLDRATVKQSHKCENRTH